MRIDWYTKGVLTVIAVLLGVIALRPYVSPDAVVHAQESFAGVQLNGISGVTFFDTRSGDIWTYAYLDTGASPHHYRVNKLGAPLTAVK